MAKNAQRTVKVPSQTANSVGEGNRRPRRETICFHRAVRATAISHRGELRFSYVAGHVTRRQMRGGAIVIRVLPILRGSAVALLPLSSVARLWARPQSLPGLTWNGGTTGGSLPMDIVVLLTLLTLVPAILLSMTPFVRLLVVFHF